MKNDLIYLDTYLLQQDMRIRMPKLILSNLGVEKGVTRFAIYLDNDAKQLVLKIAPSEETSDHGRKD